MALHPPRRLRRVLSTQRAFPRSGRSRWTPWKRTGTGGDTGGDTRAAGLTQRSAGWTRGPGSAGQPSLAPRRPTGMGCSGSPPRPRAQLAVVQTPWAALPRLLLAQRERCSAPAKQRAWGSLLKARARGRTTLQPARPPSARLTRCDGSSPKCPPNPPVSTFPCCPGRVLLSANSAQRAPGPGL